MSKINGLLLFCGLVIVGWSTSAYSIAGGATVSTEDAFRKHIVGIIDTVDGEMCTGTLIRRDVVLTAAHCFDSSEIPGHYVAVFGLTIDPRTGKNGVPVAAIRIPLQYNAKENRRNSSFDIALVKLAKAPPSGFYPATVATKMDYFLDLEESYIAAGYGVTKYKKQDPGILRKLTAKGTKLAVRGQSKHIELKAMGAGPCSGDSGSPLFKVVRDSAGIVSYRVMGVQSQGIQRAVGGKFVKDFCEDVGLYTNLPFYSKWLEENVGFSEQ